jgi:hypothetical protein
MDPRVRLTIKTTDGQQEHVLTLDTPRASWTLEELHELGRTIAEAAGILGAHTDAVAIDVQFSDDE